MHAGGDSTPCSPAGSPLKPGMCVPGEGVGLVLVGGPPGSGPRRCPQPDVQRRAELWAGIFPLPPKSLPCGGHRGQRKSRLGPLSGVHEAWLWGWCSLQLLLGHSLSDCVFGFADSTYQKCVHVLREVGCSWDLGQWWPLITQT